MKFKFINPSNCRKLLPSLFDLKILRDFDSYLDELDDYEPHRNIVSKLVTANQKSSGKGPWDRIFSYDIDICFDLDLQKKSSGWHIQDYIAFSNPRTGPNKKVDALFSMIHWDGIRWTFRLPIQYLLKGWGDANEGYQGYTHCVKTSGKTDLLGDIDPDNPRTIEKCYTGITKRNWLIRLGEHLREVRQGGKKKQFHRAWREALDANDLVYSSCLHYVNLSYGQAMEWEERYVKKWSLSPMGFNMIPGGFEGFKHLYEHRITDRIEIDLDERENAISEYLRQNPRKGIPNPFMSELWQDDEYYLKVIGSKEKTLTAGQVREIRRLGKEGLVPHEILIRVGGINERQIKSVLQGKTYKRVK